MKILFIIPSYKPAYIYGGTTVVISKLAEQLVKEGNEVYVYTTTANGKEELNVEANKPVMVDGVKVFYFSRVSGDHTHVSPKLVGKLWSTVKNFDVVHIHSWWSLLIFAVATICKLRGVKPIISPHGMISAYTFKSQNTSVKKILHSLLGNNLFKSSYLHACTELEWKDSTIINPDWQGFVVSNLIDIPSFTTNRTKNDVFTICFLSRIDPKKNLEQLITALSRVQFPFRLKIAGAGENDYIESLKKLISESGIDSSCEWVGWKNGDDKFTFLAQSDLFVLSSFNENFAIVVTEALSVGTPVLLSEGVGLADYVKKKDLGWVTKLSDLKDLEDKLNRAHEDSAKRARIINEAPALIRQDFDPKYLTKLYLAEYKKISLKK